MLFLLLQTCYVCDKGFANRWNLLSPTDNCQSPTKRFKAMTLYCANTHCDVNFPTTSFVGHQSSRKNANVSRNETLEETIKFVQTAVTSYFIFRCPIINVTVLSLTVTVQHSNSTGTPIICQSFSHPGVTLDGSVRLTAGRIECLIT